MSTFMEKQRKIRAQVYREFKKSLKDSKFDELVTMYIFRPIAFIFVKLLYKTNSTPNAVSFFGIALGLLSSIFLIIASPTSIVIAAALYFFAVVADNADGMLARLTGKGTPMGRIIDGFSDYAVGIVMYIGLLVALNKGALHAGFFGLSPLTVLVISALSIIAHGVSVDYYRGMFTSFGLGKKEAFDAEDQIFQNKLSIIRSKDKRIIEKVIILLFTVYYTVQHKLEGRKKLYNSESYYNANKTLIMLWFWIGPATHALVFFISLVLFKPVIYFTYTIILANAYMLVLLVIQNIINSRLKLTIEDDV